MDMIMDSRSKDMANQLMSFERMRASPELWPEQIPGVSGFVSGPPPINAQTPENSPQKGAVELETIDMDLLQEFGSLTTAQLLEKVRWLQNLAYQLGLEETHEMTRGKFLNILEKPQKRS